MLWIPPPSWFVAVALASIAHIGTVIFVFLRFGWRCGLIALPIQTFALLAGTIGGVVCSFMIGEIAPLPLVLSLVGTWWLSLLYSGSTARTNAISSSAKIGDLVSGESTDPRRQPAATHLKKK